MKMIYYIFLILFTLGCDDPAGDCCTGPNEVNLDEPFSINEGETVKVASSILNIEFESLVSDSMCPEDVECVTQGTLVIAIDVNGTKSNLSIGDDQNSVMNYRNYTIELQKLVYPTKEGEKANTNSTYAVQMLITRS